jgi:putative two-component system response regulator
VAVNYRHHQAEHDPATVLVVDDEQTLAELIARVLEDGGYRATVASNVSEAREELAGRDFDLVVCDLNLPGESGLELLEHVHLRHPDTGAVVVSGTDDPDVALTALELGAYGYVVKPFGASQILISAANALRHHELEVAGRARWDALERAVSERTAELRKSREETIQRVSRVAEFRDEQTGRHSRRMSELCGGLAVRAGLDEERCELLRIASPLHDVGKVAIPDGILLKPGLLTRSERRVMERHAEIGHRMLEGSGEALLDLAAEVALTHHERFDGLGYPQGLKGAGIPIAGRIAAVADVFDALTSDRVYRSAVSLDESLEIMRNGRGTQFDPDLLDLFLGSVGELAADGDPKGGEQRLPSGRNAT